MEKIHGNDFIIIFNHILFDCLCCTISFLLVFIYFIYTYLLFLPTIILSINHLHFSLFLLIFISNVLLYLFEKKI